MKPPIKYFPLPAQLLVVLGLFLICQTVATIPLVNILVVLLGKGYMQGILGGTITTNTDRLIMLLIQAFGSLAGFALAALLFNKLRSGYYTRYLGFNKPVTFQLFALAALCIVLVQPLIGYLVSINKAIPLPSFLHFLVESEASREALSNNLMGFTDAWMLIPTAIVMAIIPAIGEELLLRGIVMRRFLASGFSPWAAIVISGFLFSIMHLHYSNTIAIWVLGIFLGYLYYASGSLWLPIAAHFLNNFLAVLLKYLLNIGVISAEVAEADTPIYVALITTVLLCGCLYFIKKLKQPAHFDEDEEDEDHNNTESELIPVQ